VEQITSLQPTKSAYDDVCKVLGVIWTGFGFVIGFIGLFDTVRDNTLQISVHSHDFQQSSGTGLQRQTSRFLWVPELFPCLSHSNSRHSH
jgi:hypothetical protein